MKQIIVFTKPSCVQCNQTKLHLRKRGLTFDERPLIGDDLDSAIKLGYKSAPVVFAGDQHWNGYRPDRIDALLKGNNDNAQAS